MYESYFGFHSRPFSATPDAEKFFPNENTRRAFDSIIDCVDRATGAAVIVGRPGLGKSVLLRAIGKHFQTQYSVVILESAGIGSRKELLQNILFELGLPFHGMEEGELRLMLMDYLKPSDSCPNGMLLCVDESHLLSINLLEECRMITNLVRNGQPRVRLVIAGNPSIEEKLADPVLESLSQRISCRTYLDSLNATECRQYISDSLQAAGQELESIFEEDALEAVYVATHGIPRFINQVCDHAFVLAIADGQKKLNQKFVNDAWSDIQRLPVDWNVLGGQSETASEHVIEFGDMDPTDMNLEVIGNDPAGILGSAGTGNDPDAIGERCPDSPSFVESSGESEKSSVQDDGPEFVFEGPRDPFNEDFAEEEQISDKFNQIIGHSPSKPAYPISFSTSDLDIPQTSHPETFGDTSSSDSHDSMKMKMEMDKVPGDGLTDDPLESVGENAHAPTIDKDDSIMDSVIQENTGASRLERECTRSTIEDLVRQSKLNEESTEQVTSEPLQETGDRAATDSVIDDSGSLLAETSLSDYLANTREAISFGVGLEPSNQQEPSLDEPSNTYPRDSEVMKSVFETSDPEPTACGSGTEQEESTMGANAAMESDAPDSTPQTVGMGIDQTVQELRSNVEEKNISAGDLKDVDNVPSVVKGETELSDDRDMIIIEPEEKNVAFAPESDTLPLRDSDSGKPSTRARREDYRQLFDRLRNG